MPTPLSEIEPAFGHWLAGFVDGEGCFLIKGTAGPQFALRFDLGLRADEAPILREIQRRLDIGLVAPWTQRRVGASRAWERQDWPAMAALREELRAVRTFDLARVA